MDKDPFGTLRTIMDIENHEEKRERLMKKWGKILNSSNTNPKCILMEAQEEWRKKPTEAIIIESDETSIYKKEE